MEEAKPPRFSKLGRALILVISSTLAYQCSKSIFKKETTHQHCVKTRNTISTEKLNNSKDELAISFDFLMDDMERINQEKRAENDYNRTLTQFLFIKNFETKKNLHRRHLKNQLKDFKPPTEIISKHIQRMGISNSLVENSIKKLQMEKKNISVTSVLNEIRSSHQDNKIVIDGVTTTYDLLNFKTFLLPNRYEREKNSYSIVTQFDGVVTEMEADKRRRALFYRLYSTITVFCTTSLSVHIFNSPKIIQNYFIKKFVSMPTRVGLVCSLSYMIASPIVYGFSRLYKSTGAHSLLILDEYYGTLIARTKVEDGKIIEPAITDLIDFWYSYPVQAVLGSFMFYVSKKCFFLNFFLICFIFLVWR